MQRQRLERVVRAGREIAAARRQYRRQEELIKADETAQQQCQHAQGPPTGLRTVARNGLLVNAEAAKRGAQILDQRRIGPRRRRRPRDQHVIVPRRRVSRHDLGRGGTQPPPCAVAKDGDADLAAGGEAEPYRLPARHNSGPKHLQDEARRRPPSSRRRNLQKLRSPRQPRDRLRHRHPFRPTGACAPWHAGRRELCARRRSQGARESRGAACGRACWVDRCASRSGLRQRLSFETAPLYTGAM